MLYYVLRAAGVGGLLLHMAMPGDRALPLKLLNPSLCFQSVTHLNPVHVMDLAICCRVNWFGAICYCLDPETGQSAFALATTTQMLLLLLLLLLAQSLRISLVHITGIHATDLGRACCIILSLTLVIRRVCLGGKCCTKWLCDLQHSHQMQSAKQLLHWWVPYG